MNCFSLNLAKNRYFRFRNLYQFCKSPQFCPFQQFADHVGNIHGKEDGYQDKHRPSQVHRRYSLLRHLLLDYGVLLEFEKRMSVNMQEINSKLWIMGRIMEEAKGFIFIMKMMWFPFEIEAS